MDSLRKINEDFRRNRGDVQCTYDLLYLFHLESSNAIIDLMSFQFIFTSLIQNQVIHYTIEENVNAEIKTRID